VIDLTLQDCRLADYMCTGTLCTGKLYIDKALMQGCLLRAINSNSDATLRVQPMFGFKDKLKVHLLLTYTLAAQAQDVGKFQTNPLMTTSCMKTAWRQLSLASTCTCMHDNCDVLDRA